MLSTVMDILTPFTLLDQIGEITDKQLNKIKRLKCSQLDAVVSMMNNQSVISQKSRALYKLDIPTNKFELISYIENDLGDTYHTLLNITDTLILFQTLSPACLVDYYDKTTSNIIILLFSYGCEAKNTYHQAALIINKLNYKVYLIDPNGHPEYFNDILDFNIVPKIELLFKNYFAELVQLGLKLEYVPVTEWNPYNIGLNKKFKITNIGSGHCVVLTLVLCHIITSQQLEPMEAYQLLGKLDDGELLMVISCYTQGICLILDS
jgi:hypothetical protein